MRRANRRGAGSLPQDVPTEETETDMLGRVLFVLVVCGVYLGMNWYVLAGLCRLFAIGRSLWFYLALVVLTLSFVTALALESAFGTGAFFSLAMLWFGTCFLLLWTLATQQLLSLVLPLSRQAWAGAVCGLVAVLVVYAFVNARTITVRRERIPGLPLTVAQLSDMHIGSIGTPLLADIVARTNALRPDLVLITGDMFDNANPVTRAAVTQLKGFAAPVLFSTGNHEIYTGLDNVRQMLSTTTIRWLRNEAVELQGVRIIGVDNSYGTELLQGVLARLAPSPSFTILMNHQPRGLEIAARHRIDLMVSGHVHDGQIWPFNYVVGLFYPYLEGLHRNGGTLLNVSTGTGIWGPPLRLGSHNEIVLFEPLP